jgi:hypothetical protein
VLLAVVLAACVRQGFSGPVQQEGAVGDGSALHDRGHAVETGVHLDADAGDAAAGTDVLIHDGGSPDTAPAACKDPVCDLWPQCGCPPGEKCEVLATGQRQCTTAGTTPHGEPCLSSGACIAGTTCVAYAEWPSGLNTCMQYCYAHADCSKLGVGSLCAIGTDHFTACTIACDIVAQTGCPTGTQCSLFNFNKVAGTACTAIGTQKQGAACNAHFDCVPTLGCINSTCQPICIVGVDTCPAKTTCFDTGMAWGSTHYGFCL